MRLSTALALMVAASSGSDRLGLLQTMPLSPFAAASPSITYSCDPCLDRSRYSVQAIVHGSSDDPFWKQVRAAALQSALDTNVELTMDLGPSFDPTAMVKKIEKVTKHYKNNKADRPSALVVSIPTSEVADAVKGAIDAGVPVLGINSGTAVGKTIGVHDFIAPDDYQGGQDAANEMTSLRSQLGGIQSALFVNDEKGNSALDERLSGFSDALGGAKVTELVVDGADPSSMSSELSAALQGCPYQAVLLSGTRSLPHAIAAYKAAGCTVASQPLGAFDNTQEIFDAIGSDELSFTVGQQQALQGALAVHLAAVFASTGKSLALPQNGAYLSGPYLITKSTLPTDTRQRCEDDAWPVCPNVLAPDGTKSQCDCIDRPMIKIGGVTHGVTTDAFWDPVYAASTQAAVDMDVELLNERFPNEDDPSILETKMANQIEKLCLQEQVDGIFVSIPSDAVVASIQKCLDLNIPVMSINAGAATSEAMGLMHHIGMLELNAGRGAGEKLAKVGITKALCVNHAQGVNVVEERCSGFQAAVEAAGVEYLGQVYVPDDNKANYVANVEALVEETTGDASGDWEGIGILAAGGPQHIPVIALQARHDKSVVGAFDTSSELYEAVDAGIKEFGIDQQPYLQGYMPVMLLAYAASTGQNLLNQVVESGPAFVESSPTEEQVTCEETFFETCLEAASEPRSDTTTNPNTGLIVGLVIVATALVVSVAFLAFRLNKLQNHIKDLESQGREVPRLSFSQKMSSVVKPVDTVVEDAFDSDGPVAA